jgi:ribosomal protein L7Ae-like RNA K-turn-binding protein
MQVDKKMLNMLGLATRAGKVTSGEFSVEKAIKEQKAYMCIVAGDASDNTKKLFNNKCDYYNVPIHVCFDKETLGHAIGKEARASIAILDQGFADAIAKFFESSNMEVD